MLLPLPRGSNGRFARDGRARLCAAATSRRRTGLRRSFRCSIAWTTSRAGSVRSTPSSSKRTGRSPGFSTSGGNGFIQSSARRGAPRGARIAVRSYGARRRSGVRRGRRRSSRHKAQQEIRVANRTLEVAAKSPTPIGSARRSAAVGSSARMRSRASRLSPTRQASGMARQAAARDLAQSDCRKRRAGRRPHLHSAGDAAAAADARAETSRSTSLRPRCSTRRAPRSTPGSASCPRSRPHAGRPSRPRSRPPSPSSWTSRIFEEPKIDFRFACTCSTPSASHTAQNTHYAAAGAGDGHGGAARAGGGRLRHAPCAALRSDSAPATASTTPCMLDTLARARTRTHKGESRWSRSDATDRRAAEAEERRCVRRRGVERRPTARSIDYCDAAPALRGEAPRRSYHVRRHQKSRSTASSCR